jgi:YfiH family protein
MHVPDFDWIVPDWPAPPTVRAIHSTRSGGVSSGPYGDLNLGLHVGDQASAVEVNRLRLQAALGVRVVYMDQVHGNAMQQIDVHSPDGFAADGSFTRQQNLACSVMVADCLPVLFCDAAGLQVAAAHAGWRGLLGMQGRGVLEAAVASFASTQGLMAWLGPCIGPNAFEVGDEVRTAFAAASPQAVLCFRPSTQGKWLADLQALARQRLAALGVTHLFGNDGSPAWCTVQNPSRFFSHRRDRISGRMAACIWRSI